MSIRQNFPTTPPSLVLDFANSKTLDPRITFSRTTTATRVNELGLIETVSADVARFDHKYENGVIKSLGLLIEEQKTNLVPYSSDMSQWSANGSPIYADNDTTAPDGTLTADKLTGNVNVFDGRWIAVTISTNTIYTVSSFIKPTDQPITRIGIFSSVGFWYGNVDTNWDANGEPTTQNSAGVSNIKYEPYPNGWYRVSFQFTSPATINGTVSYFHMPDRIASGKSAWFWGAQLETDKDVSSYIPTSGSTFTRNSDNVWMDDITDFFNPNEGTAIITYRPRFDGVYNTPFQALFAIKNTTTGRSIGFDGNSNAGQLYFDDYINLLQDNNGRFTWLDPPSPSTQRSERVLVSYANTYFRMYQNEIAFVSTNELYGRGKISEYIPSAVEISTLGFNAIIFGSGVTGNTNAKFNYTLQQFIYYPSEVGVSNARTLSKRP